MKLSEGQKAAVLVVVVGALAIFGVVQWFVGGSGEDGPPPADTTSTSAPRVTPQRTTPGANPSSSSSSSTTPSSSSSSSSDSSSLGQDESAKAALKSLVPKWGSLDMETVGPDEDGWVDTWEGDPAASSEFIDQSRGAFTDLFSGVFALEANANVDSLTSVDKAWVQGSRSGWDVTFKRTFDVPGADGDDIAERVTFEFTVEQQDGGESEVISFTEPNTGD